MPKPSADRRLPTHSSTTIVAEKMPATTMKTTTGSRLLGAMFLMATSAIGPGFITQTTTFTVKLGAAFAIAIAIAISIVLDIALQLNMWREMGRLRQARQPGATGLGWVMAAVLLPVGSRVPLWAAWRRTDPRNGYTYPCWLHGIGRVGYLLTVNPSAKSIGPVIDLCT